MNGRPKTSGRFSTRAELVRRVRVFWETTDLSLAAIARNCHVSGPLVAKIIKEREWDHLRSLDFAENHSYEPSNGWIADEPIEVEIENLHQYTCGSGWMPESCPVHLEPRLLNELERHHDLLS